MIKGRIGHRLSKLEKLVASVAEKARSAARCAVRGFTPAQAFELKRDFLGIDRATQEWGALQREDADPAQVRAKLDALEAKAPAFNEAAALQFKAQFFGLTVDELKQGLAQQQQAELAGDATEAESEDNDA
jgi:hypothetical protein